MIARLFLSRGNPTFLLKQRQHLRTDAVEVDLGDLVGDLYSRLPTL